MKQALIIVDVQSFFLADAPKNLPDKIKENIESSDYSAVAFTVFRNTADSNFAKSLNWTKCDNEDDTRLPEELNSYVSRENTFVRNTYSGFAGTSLDEYLESKDIEKLILCGIDTDACVLATAFSSFDLGFQIDIDFDLTFSSNKLKNQAIEIMKQNLIAQDKQAK